MARDQRGRFARGKGGGGKAAKTGSSGATLSQVKAIYGNAKQSGATSKDAFTHLTSMGKQPMGGLAGVMARGYAKGATKQGIAAVKHIRATQRGSGVVKPLKTG
jgi:hypothetical protein